MSGEGTPVDQDRLDKALADLDNWYDNALKNGAGFKNEGERKAYLESLGDIEKHPMFATKTEDLEGNPLVEAIRAIKEENKTNYELAVLYKDEGNGFMKMKVEVGEGGVIDEKMKKKRQEKNLYEAHSRYTHAMTYLEREIVEQYQSTSTSSTTTTTDQQEEQKNEGTKTSDIVTRSVIYQNTHLLTTEQKQLLSQLYSNRAATSLVLQNYGSVKQDCTIAIQIWKENSKAYVRKSKALFSLKQYQYCLDFTQLALEILSSSSSDRSNDLNKQIDEISSYYNKSQIILNQQISKLQTIHDSNWKSLFNQWKNTFFLCQRLGLRLSYFNYNPPEPLQLKDVWPQYHGTLPLATTPASSLTGEDELAQVTWPTLFLYPQYNQLDIIPDANISSMIAEYLAMIFPEPEEDNTNANTNNAGSNNAISWDVNREYHISNLVVYVSISLSNYSMMSSDSDNGDNHDEGELEWIISCLEYYCLLVNGGSSLEFMKYALKDLLKLQKEKKETTPPTTTATPVTANRMAFNTNYSKYFHPSTIDELTLEDVNQMVKVTEESMQSYSTKKSQQLAVSSSMTNFSSQFYYEVHLGCSIYSILKAVSQYQALARGILSFVIFPRNSKAHRIFLQKNQKEGIPILPLNPK